MSSAQGSTQSQDSAPPPMIQIFEEKGPDKWQPCGDDLNVVKHKQDKNILVLLSNEMRDKNKRLRESFQKEFQPVLEDDINGSFHCEYGSSQDRAWPEVSWSCFKVKEVKSAKDYSWKQPTIHVNWNPETGRQLVYVLESPLSEEKFRANIPPAEERRCNPFSWHAAFADMVLEQYNGAFWLLRDLVRAQEKARSQEKAKPQKKAQSPKKAESREKAQEKARSHSDKKSNDFPLLHDILRHLFHYQETIDVAIHTLQMMVEEQTRWREEDEDKVRENLGVWMRTRQHILYQQKRAHSLKTRSKSLNDRHQNEINLAFNLVSQGFGRDARSDSNMMKTVAVVSMVYLPGTFVSGLFGTNFFSFQADPQNTWLMANEFWIYWAVTLPLTFLTMIIWALWHYQETYTAWWRKAFGKAKSSGDSDAGSNEDKLDGDDEKISILTSVARITTALRLGEVQRTETV